MDPFDALLTVLWSLFGFVLLGWLSTSLVMVKEKTYKTTVLFGSRFNRVLLPGLRLKWPFPVESVDELMHTRISELPVTATSLTKDKATITLKVCVQWVPSKGKYYEAAYTLENPEQQISSYIENSIRAKVTSMDVEEVFSSTDHFEIEVKDLLQQKFTDYGYDIVNVLIDQPQISKAMAEAYERKLIAVREQEAATAEGEAVRIRMTAKATAEGQSLEIKGKAFQIFRKLISEGNSKAINEFMADLKDDSVSAKDIMDFFAGVDERDAMRDSAQHGGKVVYIGGRTDRSSIPSLIAANEASKFDGVPTVSKVNKKPAAPTA